MITLHIINVYHMYDKFIQPFLNRFRDTLHIYIIIYTIHHVVSGNPEKSQKITWDSHPPTPGPRDPNVGPAFVVLLPQDLHHVLLRDARWDEIHKGHLEPAGHHGLTGSLGRN